MNQGADPTDAKHILLSVTRVAALQDQFQSSEQHPRAVSAYHLAAVNLDFNFEVTFNSADRIDYNFLRH